MADTTVSQIEFEIGELDRLLASYADLFARAHESIPDLVEVTALGSVLHSFYNGLERVFLSISKGIDGEIPADPQWHRILLTRMTEATSNRAAVLTASTADLLTEYLGFRHFYRHSYSFYLEWDELEKLVTPLLETWRRVKEELQGFADTLPDDRTDGEQL